jgi:hypothetical protein
MLRKIFQLSFVIVLLALSFQAAAAQTRTERIRFARGADHATKTGVIKGYATVDYIIHVNAGQRVKIKLNSRNPSMYFTFDQAGSETTQQTFDAPDTRDYTITVFLMRSAARRGTTASYSLTVRIA